MRIDKSYPRTVTEQIFKDEQGFGHTRKTTISGGTGLSFVLSAGMFMIVFWVLLGTTAIWDNQTMILLIVGGAIYFMMRR